MNKISLEYKFLKKKHILIFLVALVLLYFFGFFSSKKSVNNIETVIATESEYQETLGYTGTIKSPVNGVINSPVNGHIMQIHKSFGQKVTAGDDILTIDSPETQKNFIESTITYLKAKGQMQEIEKSSRSNQALFDAGVISLDEMTKSKTQLYTNKVEYIQATNSAKKNSRLLGVKWEAIEKLEINQIEKLESILKNENKIKVKAPYDGILLSPVSIDSNKKTIVDAGSKVESGSNLAVIGKPDSFEINLEIPETDIHYIEEGQKVTIKALSQPDDPIKGVVHNVNRYNISHRGHDEIAKFPVLITAQCHEDKCNIQSGMTAEVIIEKNTQKSIAVPLTSVSKKDGKTYVEVEKSKNNKQQRSVKLGNTIENKVVVKDGLQKGEKIAKNNSM